MEKGPLAGCKVVNIKAVLYDGSYHDVDSNEMAFKIAASLAFKKGIAEAKPCLLEPVMRLEIIVPGRHEQEKRKDPWYGTSGRRRTEADGGSSTGRTL